jgi:hypothetical protein
LVVGNFDPERWNFPHVLRVVSSRERKQKMTASISSKIQIEDLRNHPADTETLRTLLSVGAAVIPDPKRSDFFEVESESLVYYIHISPVTGNILLLAAWPIEADKSNAGRAA